MGESKKWKFLQDIAKPYALDILEELKKKAMRFSELKKTCLSQKTLTIRLHELEDCGAIERVIEKPRKQKIKVFYTLTPKGKKIVEIGMEFLKI